MLSLSNEPGPPADYKPQTKVKEKCVGGNLYKLTASIVILGSAAALAKLVSQRETDEKDPEQRLLTLALAMAGCFTVALMFVCFDTIGHTPKKVKHIKPEPVSLDRSGKQSEPSYTLIPNNHLYPSIIDHLNRTRKATKDKTTQDRTDRNGVKALLGHKVEEERNRRQHARTESGRSPYITLEELLSERERLAKNKDTGPAIIFEAYAEAQGPRMDMEDAHLLAHGEDSYLYGVFDGHAGRQASKHVCEQFKLHFFDQLKACNGDVYETFLRLFAKIDEEGRGLDLMNWQGTTVVVCYIFDRKIWTATLGDSEANIYRKINGTLKSIPLSYVHDWSHPKDAGKGTSAIGKMRNLTDQQIAFMKMEWINAFEPKHLRYPEQGLNVSRDLGCNFVKNYVEGHPAVSSKPKITCESIDDGDIIIISCDGLHDYHPEKETLKIINNTAQFGDIPSSLVNGALGNMSTPIMGPNGKVRDGSGDNVTVLAGRVYFKKPAHIPAECQDESGSQQPHSVN